MAPHARINAPWYRARASMYSTACWSFIALVLLGCLVQVSNSWRHAVEFMTAAALVTFALSLTLGLGTSFVGHVAMSVRRRKMVVEMLEKPGRAMLTMKPAWALLAVAFFRFMSSAMFQAFGALLIALADRGDTGLYALGGVSMAIGLVFLLAGMSRVSEYAHMRDAWSEAQWLGGVRRPGVRQ